MSDPTEYLFDRYAEDEAAARRCAEVFPPPWDVSDRGHTVTVRADAPNFWPVTVLEQSPSIDGWLRDYVEHIARHDPARVLADVAAKRAVVEQHREEPCPFGSGDLTGNCETCAPRQQGESNPLQRYAEDYPCPTLRALLQEFASRKDFPDEWRTT